MIAIAVEGLDQLLKKFDGDRKRVRVAIARGTNKAADIVVAAAKSKVLKGPWSKSGTKVKRGGKWHYASVPGEPPATDMGQLVSSIHVVKGTPGDIVTALCIADAPYAAALEYGTKDGKIKERPFMRQALEQNLKLINQVIVEAVTKAFNP
jgi:HK97 gp10 family phage protein